MDDLAVWTSQVTALLSWLLPVKKDKKNRKNKIPDLIRMADEDTKELPLRIVGQQTESFYCC